MAHQEVLKLIERLRLTHERKIVGYIRVSLILNNNGKNEWLI